MTSACTVDHVVHAGRLGRSRPLLYPITAEIEWCTVFPNATCWKQGPNSPQGRKLQEKLDTRNRKKPGRPGRSGRPEQG